MDRTLKKAIQIKSKKIVCLYIEEKFLDQNVKPDDLDYVIMDYNSVFADLLSTREFW